MIPEPLLHCARTHWGRQDLGLIAEIEGHWLVEMVPHYDVNKPPTIGDRFVIASVDPTGRAPSGWNGWCCSPPVMRGEIGDTPEPVLEVFRNILSLIP